MKNEKIIFDFDIWWLELYLPEWFHLDDSKWWYLENEEWTFGIYINWIEFWNNFEIVESIQKTKNSLQVFKEMMTWERTRNESKEIKKDIWNFILNWFSSSENYWIIHHSIASNKWFIKMSFHDYNCEDLRNAQKIHDEILSKSDIYFNK